ncbi:Imm32 family immunity protein [Actinomadura alba]|uniref:Uncharacterized protein n=1 Tax=Actinomadura alba TaxID=406431 RepID=A0ABR7LVL9_9ACTN|nr:hypothetical protein [Actinomadura alba]MBC6468819.1 hypothetical protein [Actinomadura alba]
MRILFFPPTGEVDLLADHTELTGLAFLVASGTGTTISEDAPGDIQGQVALHHVRVRVANGEAVMITADASGRSLTITGDLRSLNILADNLHQMAEAADGGHLHIEHYPDHPYIGEGSLPLVVNSPHGGMPVR